MNHIYLISTFFADAYPPSWTIDFNPLDYPAFANLFASVKVLTQWGLVLYYIQKVLSDIFQCILVLNSAHGINNQAFSNYLKSKGS